MKNLHQNAYKKGMRAGLQGLDESVNPYCEETEEIQYYNWLAGHCEGVEEYNREANSQ